MVPVWYHTTTTRPGFVEAHAIWSSITARTCRPVNNKRTLHVPVTGFLPDSDALQTPIMLLENTTRTTMKTDKKL